MSLPEKEIDRCLSAVEQKLGWGRASEWSNADYSVLSEQILAETGVHLSPTTLKRLWGRVRYHSSPNPSTLDAMARFAGFENWRDFKLKAGKPAVEDEAPYPALFQGSNRRFPIRIALAALGVCLLVWALLAFSQRKSNRLSPDRFSFSSRPLAKGIPNSVIFQYDASAAPEGDSIFIQQSWDPRRRAAVSREGREHTSIYYKPGYFMAKLVVDGQAVAEHKLFIPTEGWLAYIAREPVPVYLAREEFEKQDRLEILPAAIAQKGISLQPETPEAVITKVGTYEGLKTGNFVFEAELINLYGEGSAVCRKSEAIILTTRGPIVIPLSMPGCAGDLTVHIPHENIRATEADLSAFACDPSRWVRVRCTGINGMISMEIDGKSALARPWPSETPSEIIGMQFNFRGGGAVRKVRLEKMN